MAEKKNFQQRTYREETEMIHGRFLTPKWSYKDALQPPITASAVYRLESVERGAEGFARFANPKSGTSPEAPIYIYDRLDEPTRGMLEENLALAERGDAAICFASGMGAISALMGVFTRTGDEIVAHRSIYGCTFSLLTRWYPRYGIKTHFVDFRDLSAVEKAIRKETRLLYFESPANPTLDIIDIKAVVDLAAHQNRQRREEEKLRVAIDNTFASPVCQRPLTLGVDAVVHSLTKNIGGFGTDIGGAVITAHKWGNEFLMYRKDFGGSLSPRSAWPNLVYGLPTLHLRLRRMMESAHKVARFLESHPAVARVLYPGLESHPGYAIARRQMLDVDGRFAPGAMIYFVLKGDPQQARQCGVQLMNTIAKNALTLTLAVSLGCVKSLIEHPSSMTHSAIPAEEQAAAGMDPGGVRLSIGIEHPDDIIADLQAGLNELR